MKNDEKISTEKANEKINTEKLNNKEIKNKYYVVVNKN